MSPGSRSARETDIHHANRARTATLYGRVVLYSGIAWSGAGTRNLFWTMDHQRRTGVEQITLIEHTITSSSAEQTQEIGRRLGASAQDGDVICLSGELGAGKTTLTQGIARGLGIERRVTSPTFTLVQEYAGRVRLYHLDCYRLVGPEDLEPLGAEEWMGREGLTVIEWPERVAGALSGDRLQVTLEWDGEDRVLRFNPGGPASRRLLAGLEHSSHGVREGDAW